MAGTYEGITIGAGTRIQAGTPVRAINSDRRTYGLLVRGVVMATYVSDSPGHPLEAQADDSTMAPTAVYCDVLAFPSVPGQRWHYLRQVLVSQPTGGMHRGRVWKPRATTVDTSGTPVGDQTANPAHMDGDHVLVGFLDDNFGQPVILRGLPHPQVDEGNPGTLAGQHMKLVDGDGDPDFIRHHGVYYGVDDLGNYSCDTRWANDGRLAADGHESLPPKLGDAAPETLGNQSIDLPSESKHQVSLWDMSTPDAPVEVMRFSVDKGKVHVMVTGGETLTVEEDGIDAKLVLGNGAVSVAVADRVEVLYGALKAALDTFATHKHLGVTIGAGTSGIPDTALAAPAWDGQINSDKLTIPDTT